MPQVRRQEIDVDPRGDAKPGGGFKRFGALLLAEKMEMNSLGTISLPNRIRDATMQTSNLIRVIIQKTAT